MSHVWCMVQPPAQSGPSEPCTSYPRCILLVLLECHDAAGARKFPSCTHDFIHEHHDPRFLVRVRFFPACSVMQRGIQGLQWPRLHLGSPFVFAARQIGRGSAQSALFTAEFLLYKFALSFRLLHFILKHGFPLFAFSKISTPPDLGSLTPTHTQVVLFLLLEKKLPVRSGMGSRPHHVSRADTPTPSFSLGEPAEQRRCTHTHVHLQ